MMRERTCVGCGTRNPQHQLVRIARRSDGVIVPLAHMRGHRGRTAYLCARGECFASAAKRRGVARSLRRSGRIHWDPRELAEHAFAALNAELTLLCRTRAPRGPGSGKHHGESDRERSITALLQGLSSQPARGLPSTRREP